MAGAGTKGRAVREPAVFGKKKVIPERAVFKREVFNKARNRRRTLPIVNKSVGNN